MRASRGLLAAAASGAVGLVSLIGGAAPAGAAELQDAGWWWRANPGQASVTPPGLPEAGLPASPPETPAPPDVPEGGLVVEQGPDGATAVSAIRFDVGDASAPVLELQTASTQGVPALQACPAATVWSGTDAGRWDGRPQAACDPDDGGASVTGEEGEEGRWTFDLMTLVGDGGILDVVILPAPGEAGVAPPFRAVFEPVTASSVRTTPGSGDFSFDGGGAFSGDFGSADGFAVGSAGGIGGSLDFGGSPTMPDLGTPGGGSSAPSGSGDGSAPLAVSAPSLPDDSTATTAALAVVAVAAAVMYAAVRRPVPALQSLVPLRAVRRQAAEVEPHIGGLGRFARPRTRGPVRLG